jgi:hypothetical protein
VAVVPTTSAVTADGAEKREEEIKEKGATGLARRKPMPKYSPDGSPEELEEDDKANGYGVYVHMNGARYEGYWKDDL